MGCVKIVCEHNAYLSRVELSESFVGEGLVRIICDQSVSAGLNYHNHLWDLCVSLVMQMFEQG